MNIENQEYEEKQIPVVDESITTNSRQENIEMDSALEEEKETEPKKKKKTHKSKDRKEGLEQLTKKVIQLLQTRGEMFFKDIQSELGIGYRRAYDILNGDFN
eukprot:Anaeramoba_ignava/a349603_33.p2 GENE.a349603_33~~a349603_33.p2  ORF type:complete len:102 (-),score=45.07 a349603_33:735-1040(-)